MPGVTFVEAFVLACCNIVIAYTMGITAIIDPLSVWRPPFVRGVVIKRRDAGFCAVRREHPYALKNSVLGDRNAKGPSGSKIVAGVDTNHSHSVIRGVDLSVVCRVSHFGPLSEFAGFDIRHALHKAKIVPSDIQEKALLIRKPC